MESRLHPFPEDILAAWQRSVDLIVRLTGARVGLIMKISGEDIEVFVSSSTENNPYVVGDRERLVGSGLYCEAVIASQEMLAVSDALSSERWKNNPDIKHNMVSYLGFPIRSGDGRPFGTICLLDDKANEHHQDAVELLEKMRDLIESHLKLKETAEDLDKLVQGRTRKLQAEIAERAAAQEALQRSEARLKAAERLARLGSWERDLVGQDLYISEGLYRILGLDPALPPWEAYAAAWEGVHPDDVAATRTAIARTELVAESQEFTFRYQLPSGKTCVLEVLTEPLCDASGKVVRMRATARDITAQAQALAALARSEANLQAAGRLARLGSWERDLSTGQYFFSEEMYRIFGLEPQDSDTISNRFWSILHRDDQDTAYAVFKAVVETGAPQEATHRIILPSGEPRVVRALTQLTRHADGRPATVRGTVQDITERARGEAALAEHVKQLTILHELSQPVGFGLPLDDITNTYLERLIRFPGFDMAHLYVLQGGTLRRLGVRSRMPLSIEPEPLVAVGECLIGLAVEHGQLEYAPEIETGPHGSLPSCGAPGIHSMAALPLRSGEETLGALAIGSTAHDAFADQLGFLETIAGLIGGRLQNALLYQETRERAAGLEEIVVERTRELQAERDRTQAILETVGESVVVLDPDGCVLYANPATLQLTGATRDEILGQPLWQQWSDAMSREIWLRAQQALAAGQSWHGETSGQRKDGTRYEAALTATPLYDETNVTAPCGSVWVQRDITALKEAERLKDRFVSNVSHELRTPVSVIGLSCDNLATFGDRLSDSDRSQMLQDIHVQAHALSTLIEDILTLSQIDSGRARQPWHDIDLARLVREQAERQRPLAKGRSQELRVSVGGSVPVRGSAIQLQQVVRNLLDNAIKYTPQGGQIRCTCEIRAGTVDDPASSVTASEPDPRTWAVIEVSDNGNGIAPEHIPLLFERFYRVHEESEVPGTGLGLPIARELVLLHGGLITVASTPGEGSTFTVYLPLHDRQGAGIA